MNLVRRFAIVTAIIAGIFGVTGFALATPSLFDPSAADGAGEGDLLAWAYDAEEHTLVYWLKDSDDGKCDAVVEGGSGTVVDGCHVLTAVGPNGQANHGAAVSGAVAQLKDMEGLTEPLGHYVRDIARSSIGKPWHPTSAEAAASGGEGRGGPPDHAGEKGNGGQGRP